MSQDKQVGGQEEEKEDGCMFMKAWLLEDTLPYC